MVKKQIKPNQDGRYRSYWKKKLRVELDILEEKGYDTDWAKRLLESEGITQDVDKLVSLGAELQMLSFLDIDTTHGERIDFLSKNRNIEVWKPMEISPQKKVKQHLNAIFQAFHTELGCLHQIVYSPCRSPKVVRYEKTYLPQGQIKLAAEILFDVEGFQKDVTKIFMGHIRRRKAKFRKEGTRGIIAIDIRHLTVVDPATLSEQIRKEFTTKDAEVLDGICLIVVDPYSSKFETKLIAIPNIKSPDPLLEGSFPRGACIEPFRVPCTYAFLMDLNGEKGKQHLMTRVKGGMLVLNGQEIAKSFAAEATLGFVGLMERPTKINSIKFEDDTNRKTEITF